MPPPSRNNKKLTDFFKPVVPAPSTNKDCAVPPPPTGTEPSTPLRPEPPPADPFKNPATASAQLRRESEAPSAGPPALLREISETASSGLSSVPGSLTPPVKPRVVPSSDGEESSDDSDLENPFLMYRKGKDKITKNAPARPPLPPAKRKVKEPIRPDPVQPVKYKFSLDRLLEEKNKSLAMEEDLRRAESLMEEVERKKNEPINKRMLVAAAAQLAMGEEESERLLTVMDEKDAWRVNDLAWEFFDHKMNAINKSQRPFPVEAMKDHPAYTLVGDIAAREQMFLGGLFTMTFSAAVLPDEVLIWMLDQLCLEPREDLAFAYFQALQQHLPLHREILSASRLSSLLELVAARKEALDLNRQIQIEHRENVSEGGIKKWRFWNIKLLVQLIGNIGVQDEKLTQFACGVLIRIILDEQSAKQTGIIASIEDSLCSILSRISEDRWECQAKEIGLTAMSTILKPQFRKRVLAVLPVSSPRLHLFRRRLACAFLFEDNSYMTREYSSLIRLSKFTKLLMEDRFTIRREHTNYVELQALISIMDVAIDNGATSGTVAEKDSDVDELVERLRRIFSQIVDTNARDLTRSEAKDMLDRVLMRLTFAVRSKQKMAFDLDDMTQTTLTWKTKPPTASS